MLKLLIHRFQAPHVEVQGLRIRIHRVAPVGDEREHCVVVDFFVALSIQQFVEPFGYSVVD